MGEVFWGEVGADVLRRDPDAASVVEAHRSGVQFVLVGLRGWEHLEGPPHRAHLLEGADEVVEPTLDAVMSKECTDRRRSVPVRVDAERDRADVLGWGGVSRSRARPTCEAMMGHAAVQCVSRNVTMRTLPRRSLARITSPVESRRVKGGSDCPGSALFPRNICVDFPRERVAIAMTAATAAMATTMRIARRRRGLGVTVSASRWSLVRFRPRGWRG